MEKTSKLVVGLLFVILFINVVIGLFGNSDLRDLRKKLKDISQDTKDLIKQLEESKNIVSSIRADLSVFKATLKGTDSLVLINDARKRRDEETNYKKKAEIQKEIDRLMGKLSSDTTTTIPTKPGKNQ
jgi:predicted RNase H-like nuclease (RuvC/YqgF family)